MVFFEQTSISDELITLFSRLRVATDITEISIVQNTAIKDLVLTEGEISGSGTSSNFDADEKTTTLTVGTSVGLRRLRSRVAGLYIAGNSLLCFMTFNLLTTGQANVVKRVGYSYGNDGVFLEQENGVLSWVIRSGVTGSLVENRVIQSNWGDPNGIMDVDQFNTDKGPGYNFDHSKTHILWIALEWLGVGDVYCGFINNAKPVVANIFRHPNMKSEPYMSTANCFLAYEIERKVAGGSSESLKTICSTLKSEGTDSKRGVDRSLRLLATKTTSTANVFRLIITFRLNPNHLNARVLLRDFSYLVGDNSDANYELLIVANPVFAGGTYTPLWTDLPNSSIQYEQGFDNTLSVVDWDYVAKASLASSQKNLVVSDTSVESDLNFLDSTFDDEPVIWALIVQASTASVTIQYANIRFWEQL